MPEASFPDREDRPHEAPPRLFEVENIDVSVSGDDTVNARITLRFPEMYIFRVTLPNGPQENAGD